ncbi:MAG: hypothetical protein JO325_24395, partial [Solirubrobacterales bacterium]|nr:hypothetical protein [Solirubrobacterales bacterium]
MFVESRTSTLRDYRNAVAGQVEARLMLGEIEAFIEACPIDEEQKSVLWLWAWLHQPPAQLHVFAESEVLRLVHGDG